MQSDLSFILMLVVSAALGWAMADAIRDGNVVTGVFLGIATICNVLR